MSDDSCQKNDCTQLGYVTQKHSNVCDKVTTDIESLEAKVCTIQSLGISFENILKVHDVVLSLYNRFAELNEKYLWELNERKLYINSLEQKRVQVRIKKTAFNYPPLRLIAQDKYYQVKSTGQFCVDN